jgi:hypothetical protein
MEGTMFTTANLHWLAGILEGEGFFGLRRHRDLVIQVSMTDRDIIDRIHTIVGFGSRKSDELPSGKIAYILTLTVQHKTAGLMMTLLPLMGARRAAKIRYSLAQWKTKPLSKRHWTHCKNGHDLSGTNLLVIYEGKYRKRRCRACTRLRTAKYRAKLAA